METEGGYSAGNEDQWGWQCHQGDKYEQRSRIYVYEGVKMRLIMRQLNKLIKRRYFKMYKISYEIILLLRICLINYKELPKVS